MGFRPFVYRAARARSLSGSVRNRADGLVTIVVQGDEGSVDGFLDDLKSRKPPLARYDSFEVNRAEDDPDISGFSILSSSMGKDSSASTVPADVAICDDCLRELRDEHDRRNGYFFITCTNCGPRFSMVERLPYDRENTTMRKFPVCADCAREYEDPSDRRFHSETIACASCGPRVYLTDSAGRALDVGDPVREAARMLHEGRIVAVKGVGGFHLASSASDPVPLRRLRVTKHRREKPFAVMARSLEAAERFARLEEGERELLASPERPIVLLRKRSPFELSDLVSPGLGSVGAMLPYTALHYMLFEGVDDPAFVMTSANPAGMPLVKDNREALESEGGVADYFLMHDREIAHRCDDSVVRVNAGLPLLVRRSRGYALTSIALKASARRPVLALGAEFMGAGCVLVGEKAFMTQHVGDIESPENYLFLRESVSHLLELVNVAPEAVACDLHPTMQTTLLAKRMAGELGLDLVQVQHHHAHAASIMAEEGLGELVGIACDGVGYGTDGRSWGGEVLVVRGAGFLRAGHLEEQQMPGGDAAAVYPLRMAAAILDRSMDAEDFLRAECEHLPGGEREAEAVLGQLRGRKSPETTSAGRVLDAVSYILGLCRERTYEGEPAMKLEGAALGGRDVLRMEPEVEGGVLSTSALVREIYGKRNALRRADLAYSAEEYLASGLAAMAKRAAEEHGIRTVGFTGGVAYNAHILGRVKESVEKDGLSFRVNREVPCGDGGVALGQALVASRGLEE